jgi:hypothetical protein
MCRYAYDLLHLVKDWIAAYYTKPLYFTPLPEYFNFKVNLYLIAGNDLHSLQFGSR